MKPFDIHGRLTRFLRTLHHQKHNLYWKGQRWDEIREELLQWQSCGPKSHRRQSCHWKGPEDYSQLYNLIELTSVGWGTCSRPSSPFIPSIVSILEEKCLSYACPTVVFWKQIIFFSSFTALWMERNFGPEWIIPRVSPIPNSGN